MMNTKGKPQINIFSKVDKIVFSILGILTLSTIVFWKSVKSGKAKNDQSDKVKTERKSKSDSITDRKKKTSNLSHVSILKKWNMPPELKEISGVAHMDDQRFACVQDEIGTIFIFNTTSNKIERKINFAEKGDFEGVALKGDTAYVVRADGKLYEVDISNQSKRSAKVYQTSLTIKHDVEGLCYDKDNDRLLLSIKNEDPDHPGYKGIYAFDLASKSFNEKPVLRIDLKDKVFSATGKKTVMPSEIGIHPITKEIFITDGPNSKLLILDKEGLAKSYLDLGKSFSQAEGITFNSEGQMFISNEGTKEAGNILQVEPKAD